MWQEVIAVMRGSFLAFVVCVGCALVSCSDEASSDDSDDGGESSMGGTGGSSGSGGSGGGGPGTGLALGTFCIQIAGGAERCETTGNRARREIVAGNVTITVEHGTAFGCQAATLMNFNASTTLPDGVLPYTNVTQAGVTFVTANNSCQYAGGAATGTIYQAGTQGATRIEGELNFAAARATTTCGPSLDNCAMQVSARVRFNVAI